MTNAAILFCSTYVLVFALGLQSLNVNGGHRMAAVLTSYFIGGTQMILLKLGPDANWLEIAAYLNGGPLGILTSMWAHPHLVQWMAKLRHARAARRIARGGDEHANVGLCGSRGQDTH